MSRSSDNSVFSRNRVRDFGGPNDDDGGHPDYGDLLNKKFSTSQSVATALMGLARICFYKILMIATMV